MFPEDWWHKGAILGFPDGTLKIGWGECKSESIDPDQPSFYVPDFFLRDEHPWRQYSNHLNLKLAQPQPESRLDCSLPIFWETLDLSTFENCFSGLMNLIEFGDMKKGVPYTFLRSEEKMSRMKLKRILHSALSYAGRCGGMIYGFWDENVGMVGVSPETLFHLEGLKLQTMALAGTKSREFPKEMLLEDPKERYEHQLVIDGIVESLSPWGRVEVGELTLLELPTLYHLKTAIQVELKHDPDIESLVKSLHPTPALGAFPKKVGSEWLKKMDDLQPRGKYGAPFGIRDKDVSHFIVAIRNMQWDSCGMRLGAGCGVVKGSECSKEWQEIQLKLTSIKRILGVK